MSAAATTAPVTIEVHGTTYQVEEERQIGNVRLVLGFREWVGDHGVERTWIVIGLRLDGSADGGFVTHRLEERARDAFKTSVRDRTYREKGLELPGRKAREVLSEAECFRSRGRLRWEDR